MKAYRITRAEYRDSVLSGKGSSSMDGGRWNRPGSAAVYLAENGALALAEVLAHVQEASILSQLVWFVFDLPEDNIATLDRQGLPVGWNRVPHTRVSQAIGTAFLDNGEYLGLRVPSVIVPFESNFLLNPFHPLIRDLSPVSEIPLKWDRRLLPEIPAEK